MKVLVTQSCPTLWDPIDFSLPGSSVHGILRARILEWVDFSFSRGSSWTQGLNLGLLHYRQVLYHLYGHREVHKRKKAEGRRIDAFKLWCWRRLLRVPWIVKSNQSISNLNIR